MNENSDLTDEERAPDGEDALAGEGQTAQGAKAEKSSDAAKAPERGSDKTGTLLDTAGDAPPTDETPADETRQDETAEGDPWEGLKERLARGDSKILNQLNRYASLENFARAGLAAQQKIRSGEFARPLAEDASAEEIADYRKQNGIPAEASGYELPEINGHEWGEEDQEVANAFLERMHAQNAPPELVSEALAWYGEHVSAEAEAQDLLDREDQEGTEKDLRTRFGPDYRATMALISRLVEDGSQGFGAVGIDMLKARLPDGRQLGAVAEFMAPLAALARTTYGDGGFVAGDTVAAIIGRKKEIQAIMKSEPERYYRDGLDKEYLAILEREQKAKTRAA